MPKPRTAALTSLLSALLLVASTLVVIAAPRNLPATPEACSELIINGNFESGGANWTQEGGNGVQLISTFNPRTGQYSADLGGQNTANHSIRQQFTVPPNSIVTLSFWWEQWTQETAPSTKDYLAVNVLGSNGALLTELARLGVDPDRPPWEQLTFSLSAYAGDTVQLQFKGVNDELLPSEFFVDDVSITVCTAKHIYLPLIRR